MGSKYTSARRYTSPQPDTVRCRSFIRRESSIDQARLVARIVAITGWDYGLRFQGLDGCFREISRPRSRMRRISCKCSPSVEYHATSASGRSSLDDFYLRRFLPSDRSLHSSDINENISENRLAMKPRSRMVRSEFFGTAAKTNLIKPPRRLQFASRRRTGRQ